MMRIEKLIKAYSFYNLKSLSTREAVDLLFENISDSTPVRIEIDFTNIDSISRSFADQFHKNKLRYFKEKDIEVIAINCNDYLMDMFKVVANTNDPSFKREYKTAQYNVYNLKRNQSFKSLNLSF